MPFSNMVDPEQGRWDPWRRTTPGPGYSEIPDIPGLGAPPGAGATSMEEYIQELMTPRRHRTEISAGPYQYIGPSREASIHPEDFALAQKMMDWQQQQARVAEDEETRKWVRDLVRPPRGESTIQMGYSGPGGGGEGPPPRPVVDETRPAEEQGPYSPQQMALLESFGIKTDPALSAPGQELAEKRIAAQKDMYAGRQTDPRAQETQLLQARMKALEQLSVNQSNPEMVKMLEDQIRRIDVLLAGDAANRDVSGAGGAIATADDYARQRWGVEPQPPQPQPETEEEERRRWWFPMPRTR